MYEAELQAAIDVVNRAPLKIVSCATMSPFGASLIMYWATVPGDVKITIHFRPGAHAGITWDASLRNQVLATAAHARVLDGAGAQAAAEEVVEWVTRRESDPGYVTAVV